MVDFLVGPSVSPSVPPSVCSSIRPSIHPSIRCSVAAWFLGSFARSVATFTPTHFQQEASLSASSTIISPSDSYNRFPLTPVDKQLASKLAGQPASQQTQLVTHNKSGKPHFYYAISPSLLYGFETSSNCIFTANRKQQAIARI